MFLIRFTSLLFARNTELNREGIEAPFLEPLSKGNVNEFVNAGNWIEIFKWIFGHYCAPDDRFLYKISCVSLLKIFSILWNGILTVSIIVSFQYSNEPGRTFSI